jgi:primase-polymerase (primpol)-like protein
VSENIPHELKTYAHWVVWRLEERGDELTKVPYCTKTGRHASTTDSRTWATFPEALEALEDGEYDGIGFVFSSGDPFVGLDFDDVRDPVSGEVDPRVLAYIEKFEDRYVEVSVSGSGIHLITRGKLKGGTKKGNYEIYDQDRFFVLTGVSL